MVASRLHDTINYAESKTIDPEDLGYSSAIYEIDLEGGLPFQFVLGKQKYTYSSKNILYYPIYLIRDDRIKAQIGVFELLANQAINVIDEDGDIDLASFGEPLWYSFFSPEFLAKAYANSKPVSKEADQKETHQNDPDQKEADEQPEEIEEAIIEEPDEHDVMKLKVPDHIKKSKEAQTSIFSVDPHFKAPVSLKEETEEDARTKKLEFKASSKNNWVENFMHNNHYGIIETEPDGNCFFSTIVKAYKQIGQTTTVQKLRDVVASEVNDEIYSEHRTLYDGFKTQLDQVEKELQTISDTNALYKKRMKKNPDKSVHEAIISEMGALKEKYNALKTEKIQIQQNIDDFVGYMNEIHSIDQFRDYVRTSKFWADTWTLSTLERILKMKIIVLSSSAYDQGDHDGVLLCTEVNRKLLAEKSFTPNYYIMVAYNGNHYDLVTYYDKRILTFAEIPYDIKALIINKCLEKNAGIYHMIQDFKNMKSTLGLEEDAETSEDDEEDRDVHYDNTTVFMYHEKSDGAPKPGKGSNEKMNPSKAIQYTDLAKIKDWRRKLDDSWASIVFELDNHKWASVEHYMQGAKFRKGFPDFYRLFALDSNSEFSKDPHIAKKIGNNEKIKGKDLRPKEVKVDADYELGRKDEERKLAVEAKFKQNPDMTALLKATHDAKLTHFVRRGSPEVDTTLMILRSSL
jgi:predicted NAD-dependent protein-ADP-ribosyltransferase YbiA (DUF1768 family)